MKERNQLREVGVDGRIILKHMLNKLRDGGGDIVGFVLFRIGTSVGLLCTRQ